MNQTAFGILALRAVGSASGTGRSAGWLRDIQNRDGGWGFAAGSASDADTTGAVLQGLAASGNRAGIRRGISYLRGVQQPGGGFPLAGGVVNAQSTAYATQGLIAAGLSPPSVREGGRSPLDYLAAVQAGDGHYRYSSTSDQTPVWVTGQALLAVEGAAFPLSPVARTAASTSAPAGGGAPASAKRGPSAKGAEPKANEDPAASGAQPVPPPAPLPLTPTSSSAGEGDGGGLPAWLIVIASAAAALGAVWAGWVLYRRRLPADRAG